MATAAEAHVELDLPAYIDTLNLIGTAVFAISGALAAGVKRLDWFGVVVLAVVVAVGGGTLRDLVLGAPVFWVGDLTPIAVATGAAFVTIALAPRLSRWPMTGLVADAAGLSVFTVIGANKALALGFSPAIAVIAGVMTGTFGGLIRDVLTGQVPLILRTDIYATAALAGAVLYVVLAEIDPDQAIIVISPMVLVFLLRLAAVYWDWSLPTFRHGHGDAEAR